MLDPKTVTLTIDGKSVTVPEGATVLQACEQVGSPVPFYCYHPGLSIAGNCRICLVEIAGSPKLQIACNARVTEGMVVQTTGDKTLQARRDVLEFLLINHPLDCPVCDQAGECWLQDYYMQHGLYDQKFDEQKVKKPKAVPIGPTVMLDAERCILCSRCVRFTDEITKTGEFGIFNRGDHSQIGLHPGKTLDNQYSGNVVDICPVGALTDRDFRFKCRVWYLASADSVCPGCSRGCNIQIHYNRERQWRPHIAKGERVMRLKPRYNPDVNQWWMCDAGRYGYGSIDRERLEHAQVPSRHPGDHDMRPRVNGDHTEAVGGMSPPRPDAGASLGGPVGCGAGTTGSAGGAPQDWASHGGAWPQALDLVAGWLSRLRDAKQLDQVGVILSSHLTNEDLYAAKRFFEGLGVTRVVFQRPKSGDSDALLIQADKSPNARGAAALGIAEGAEALLQSAAKKQLRVLCIFTQDLADLFGETLMQEALANVELSVFIGPNENRTSQRAAVVLPSAVYAEKDGTFTNVEGRVQRINAALNPWGEAKPEWEILVALGQRLGVPLAFADAPGVFAELAGREPAFQGLTYERLGDRGALLVR